MRANAKTLNARIVGFSPPSIEWGQVALRVMMVGIDVAELSFDPVLGMELAAALRTLLGEPAPKQKRPHHELPPEQLAKYRRVVAAVNAGARWLDAAADEEVCAFNVVSWWSRQKKLDAARGPRAPILKPSGEIL